MGQKVNPVLFRLGTSTPVVSSWYTNQESYSHLLHQDIELKNFLSNVLRSRGVLLRSCRIQRSSEKLWVDLDLFFSFILAKQAKFFWARSLFKTVKKKYTKINRIKDVKNFVQTIYGDDPAIGFVNLAKTKKKYRVSLGSQKKNFFSGASNKIKKKSIAYRNRLFFFSNFEKTKKYKYEKKRRNKIIEYCEKFEQQLL